MRPTLLLATLPFALPIALAACQQAPADGSAAPEASGTMPSETDGGTVTAPAPVPSGSITATPTPTDTSGIPEGGIPVALQGNWGLVPADCTSTRGDAKGLLRVSATTLTFYESVGKLSTIRSRGDRDLRADFSFSGEGMTWTRDETLSVSGNKLTRTERGGDEPGSGGPFTYTKCAA